MKFSKSLAVIGFLNLICLSANAQLNNFAQVDEGVFRGSRPLSHSDFNELEQRGVRTILNLQILPQFVKHRAREAGFNFINIPMDPLVQPSVEKITEILNIMNSPVLRPVYVNCRLGGDRTGLVVALYQIHNGMDPVAAEAEMKAFGYKDFLHEMLKFLHNHNQRDSFILDPVVQP